MSGAVPGRADRFRLEIPSTTAAADAACLQLREFLQASGFRPEVFGIELVAREFLVNAVKHGNRLDPVRRASIELRVGRRWMVLQVTDEGKGFDWRAARRRQSAGVTATHGRGLLIGAHYGRRLRFNQAGNEVTVWFEKPVETGRTR